MPATRDQLNTKTYQEPRTAVRIVKILQFIAMTNDGAKLAQLSAEIGAPKTSLFSLLRALTDNHYLLQADGRYHLSNAAFALVAAIVARRQFPEAAMPIMRALADESGETTFISELIPHEAVAVYISRANNSSHVALDRSLPHDGDLHHKTVEYPRLETRQHRHLRAGFD